MISLITLEGFLFWDVGYVIATTSEDNRLVSGH